MKHPEAATTSWPIVIDPPELTEPIAVASRTGSADEALGILSSAEERMRWRSPFGPDPGACRCPNCQERFWTFGLVIGCRYCGFKFPTDWWLAYSTGASSGRMAGNEWVRQQHDWVSFLQNAHAALQWHPYYEYGFNHPVEDQWAEAQKINWRDAVGEMDRYPVKRGF